MALTSGHRDGDYGMRLRALTLACAAVTALAALLDLARDAARDLLSRGGTAGWEQVPFDVAITALAAVVVAACGAWLLLVAAATAVEVLAGASWSVLRAVSPRLVRRLVLVACGLAVGSAGVMPAAVALEDRHPTTRGPVRQHPAEELTGLPLPDRPRGGVEPPGRSPDPAVRAGTKMVAVAAVEPRRADYTVRPGDSLWAIARRFLPAADATTTDAAWRRIHRANREVVGPDPDLILPGTALRIPQRLFQAQHLDSPGPPDASPSDTTPPRRKDAS